MAPRQGRTESAGAWDLVKTAAEIFDDPNHVVGNNYFIECDGEQRYQAIGMTRKLVLLVVVFVDRGQPDTDLIHLIPARKSSRL